MITVQNARAKEQKEIIAQERAEKKKKKLRLSYTIIIILFLNKSLIELNDISVHCRYVRRVYDIIIIISFSVSLLFGMVFDHQFYEWHLIG